MNDPGRVTLNMATVPVPAGDMWDRVVQVLGQQGLDCSLHGVLFRPVMDPFWVGAQGRTILVFGRRGVFEGLGVDSVTGEVVDVLDCPSYQTIFVNSSIDLFEKASSWFLGRYPFYEPQSDEEVLESVACEIRQHLYDIDPPCVDPDTFWDTICWDVAIGDWDFHDNGEYVDWSLVSDDPPPVWWTEKFAPGQPTFDTIRVPGP